MEDADDESRDDARTGPDEDPAQADAEVLDQGVALIAAHPVVRTGGLQQRAPYSGGRGDQHR